MALGLAVAACGAATTSAGAGPGSASPSPGSSLRGSFGGAEGALVQMKGTTLTLVSTSGTDVTVTYTSSTPITETSTGSYQDITTGSCITGTGTKDATGSVTVSSVTVSPEVNGSCALRSFTGGSPGAFPSGRPSFSFSPRATPSGIPANFAAVRGLVTAVTGTSVTVQSAQGTSQTVTVPTTVKVSMSAQGSDSDLTNGVCVLATGSRDQAGSVSARSLSIVPPGPSGCFTGSSGFGGAGGFFGGGGGFFGGGGGGTSGGGSPATT